MEDVLAVYTRPHDPDCPRVCRDETTNQLLAEPPLPIPMKPGRPARCDYEYERNGTANLFMMFAPLEGWRHIKVTDRHTAVDYAHVLKDLCRSACNIDPLLPHLRMLLSLDGRTSDCRPGRGCVIARRIGGTGDVAECPSHAAPAPVPGSPTVAGAVTSAMCGMITSAALRLSDRNKRCTMVCCGGPNFSGECSARRPRMASAVRRGSAASQRSMSARCGSRIDGILTRVLYGLCMRRWVMRCSPRYTSLPNLFAKRCAV